MPLTLKEISGVNDGNVLVQEVSEDQNRSYAITIRQSVQFHYFNSQLSRGNTSGLLIQHGACNGDGGVCAWGFALEASG